MSERMNTPENPSFDRAAARGASPRAVERLDAEQALQHQLDRMAPARRSRFPKDDARSSARIQDSFLTDRERSERWPLG